MHRRTRDGDQSGFACGVLSHEPPRTRWAARSAFLALIGAMALTSACAGDSNGSGGAGTGGSGGSGAGGAGGTSPGGSDGSIDPDSSTDCSLRTDVDTYAANMARKGKSQVLSFQLVKSDPGPPVKGSND